MLDKMLKTGCFALLVMALGLTTSTGTAQVVQIGKARPSAPRRPIPKSRNSTAMFSPESCRTSICLPPKVVTLSISISPSRVTPPGPPKTEIH